MFDMRVKTSQGRSNSESLKAMVYFQDGDLATLTRVEKACLVEAVSTVRDLPAVSILSTQLTLPTT